ncbi:CAP domain-containing protein [Salipiger sp. IMCC34102]|uniref:CAP domain-containing protein n=1 Tax=Salipiger sp. IMCC34102 TaxID=2510647 RepID=UPI00101CF9C0|nr:CAP domain-containing protein [Salipiger sp. IMCC34102]RYH01849.1 CAP domain-containing protein [Salipiger sp. IMCC34102]
MKIFALAAAVATLALTGACVPVQLNNAGGIATGQSLPAKDPAYPAFYEELNAFRAQNGSQAMVPNAQLEGVATAYAGRIRATGELSHRLDGTTISSRVNRAGISTCTVGENLAYGFADAATVLEQWKGSPKHRANLLSNRFTHYGLGRSQNHWVMVLARPC